MNRCFLETSERRVVERLAPLRLGLTGRACLRQRLTSRDMRGFSPPLKSEWIVVDEYAVG